MPIFINGQDMTFGKADVLSKTGNYVITTADFGSTLRMNSGSTQIFTLPSVGSAEDGARLTIVKLGAGQVTIQAADSDLIGESSAGGTLYNSVAGEIYATVSLEYVHGSVKWVVRGAHGTWTTT